MIMITYEMIEIKKSYDENNKWELEMQVNLLNSVSELC